ncbi:ATP-binding protein [Lutibaculum baratangense]|uniref:histidine kinase n=1 Tax=Lutibaculum baratangense AMV1 TaxID=631454 RepID=V4RKS5_9HYPH|nr:ATP-binding protein [Lutibaculum baratangense]ESR23860.1 Phytochrome, two-component sensor histidine kinase [Lutibaculum baratangense AMV1]
MTALTPDLDACAREPIHIPGSVQPHGVLLVIDPADEMVVAASANAADQLGAPPLSRRMPDLLEEGAEALRSTMASWGAGPSPSAQVRLGVNGGDFDGHLHRADGLTIIELEPVPEGEHLDLEMLYSDIGSFVDQMRRLSEPADLCRLAAEKIRQMSGYDRVLAYRFDRDLHGTVIAEDGNGILPAYLGRRFPASDIPAQARELYRRNRLRIIPDAFYTPVAIEPDRHPATGEPFDLSQSVLRSVSPVHVEYMRNMGTGASMSASIVVDNDLWGLISCHNSVPKRVPMQIRNAIQFIAQILSIQIAMNERGKEADERVAQKTILSRLLGHMAKGPDFAQALAAQPIDLLAQTDADSAAIAYDGRIVRIGSAPAEEDIARILAWMQENVREDVFATDELSSLIPGTERFADKASGLLAASISSLHPSYLMWFRAEVVRSVEWGGDPHKPTTAGPDRLHPRTSFEAWKEQVRNTSAPWKQTQIEAAAELRSAIITIVLRQAEERARLTGQLEATNKELESFSYSISHDLRAPFRHIVGYAELLRAQVPDLDEQATRYLDTITESAVSAGRLVDDLLRFSQLGRTSLQRMPVNLDKVVQESLRTLEEEIGDRQIDLQIGRLPEAIGDAALIRQVFYNLLSNAIKYTRQTQSPRIEISGWRDGNETHVRIADNGVGFDMAYVHKLFGVFQRLHHAEDFEGTGIGLAIVRRILERHGGRILAEAELGTGARFTLVLPDAKGTEDE